MQIQQQHQMLYNRVTANDLTAPKAYPSGGTVHASRQQQQSIEMTQFEVRDGGGGGVGEQPAYPKTQPKHNQPVTVGRCYDDGAKNATDGDADARTMTCATVGRRRRSGEGTTDFCYNDNAAAGQYGRRRNSNAATATGDNYNTIGGVGYYAGDVYAGIGTRQQQAKRQPQQQRPYGVAAAEDQTLTAKRSWRRQQNRRRRPVEPADRDDDDDDNERPPDAAEPDKRRNATVQLEHHHHHHHHQHQPRQKNDRPQPPTVAAEPQVNGGGGGGNNNNNGNNKNEMVKFHDVGREIDV